MCNMEFAEKKYYDILQERAEKNPGKPAVVMGEKCLSYSDYNLDFMYSNDFDISEFLASHESLL